MKNKYMTNAKDGTKWISTKWVQKLKLKVHKNMYKTKINIYKIKNKLVWNKGGPKNESNPNKNEKGNLHKNKLAFAENERKQSYRKINMLAETRKEQQGFGAPHYSGCI